MLSPRIKRTITRILPFGIIWLLTGWVFLFIETSALNNVEQTSNTAIQVDYRVFIFASLAVLIVGFLVGLLELLLFRRLFYNYSFLKRLLYKMLLYGIFLQVIITIAFPIAAGIEMHTSAWHPQVWDRFFSFLQSSTYISTMFQMVVTLFLCLFYDEISDHVGRAVIYKFFTGKYHRPVEERRIFMFLDMKSSTTIAEQLGHLAYFRFLKQYYKDLSEAVINNEGEVYQYVGDELVVSWKLNTVNSSRWIHCFYEMQAKLGTKASWYEEHFKTRPHFKAGFHAGRVTAGEIGVIKKEILYTGDVINATARIQALCNTYDVNLIVSETLIQNLPPAYEPVSLGKVTLRGQSREMALYTIKS
ncbi:MULTISPECIES: adenylate/guanylate cyclase domain-containing protein [unclassified Leeuwenhoekiella]|uniref:adenylate/guanylate cyclase domain-containing protein n=1 Tax=unclassified Leeuwenhoekiella TaxID=2615029 RepID=UPI000C6832CA|nr:MULTISPECIES: adenylate/guanylate cyclase domain-containing protein [unclassified Leeuwenhoekiella]MAW96564.1 adenylate/guanylate cyclase domain-containing protein [Leeuwenhoekiella sp.]|tara:strand:+ start:7650 stop:8729 length:1080 start_codon:yes stop_codon:yes gene_type:complete